MKIVGLTKIILTTQSDRIREELARSIDKALNLITDKDLVGWFRDYL